jgi:pimeloyl-ACP methyl ester carboxylesterase
MRAGGRRQKLTVVLGLSCGAMIGATYASLFPGRARAIALDSPGDADVWLNRPLQAGREQDAQLRGGR